MAYVHSNEIVAAGIGLMEVEGGNGGAPGQFYMVRAWEQYPLLSRPLSIFDSEGGRVKFLYQIVGEGTRKFASLRPGDEIHIQGPFGNGFPGYQGKLALVGGGIGAAPLFFTAKQAPVLPDVYLGFRDKPYLEDAFKQVSGKLHIQTGGSVLGAVPFDEYDQVFICGPHGMLQAAQNKLAGSKRMEHVYVSVENRMACGVGACLVCSVKCVSGSKKACTDGPVFPIGEVVFHG